MNLKYCYIDGAIEGMGMDFIVIAEYPEINYTLIRRNSTYEPYVAAWGLNWETGNWDQGHYFSTINEAVLYIEEKILVKNNDLNDDEKEDKVMEREKVIELVKALGITAEELGIKPKVEIREVKDEELIKEVRTFIEEMEIDPTDARKYIDGDYWEDLGIEEKKYKIVKCTLEKTIYKNVYVAMPQDKDECNADEYLDCLYNLETYNPDDEEDWKLYETEVEKDFLTKKEVGDEGDDIWNYDDFTD